MTQLINYRLLEFGIGGNIYTTETGYKSRLRPLPPLSSAGLPAHSPQLSLARSAFMSPPGEGLRVLPWQTRVVATPARP